MREFFGDLTVNQMIGLLAGVILLVLVAAVAFSISQREKDPYLEPTPTLPVSLPSLDFDPRTLTAQAP